MPPSGSVLKRFGSIFHRQPKSPTANPEIDGNNSEEPEKKEISIKEAIIMCLMSPQLLKIGVWGMAGVGKTNCVKFVAELLQETKVKLFDYIFFVNVPYKGSLRTLRNDLGKELGLNGLEEEEDEKKAASLLYDKLRKKKFLFVLDDLWERISLEDLGVPQPTQENGCKLLVITRNRKVCDLMDTQVDLKVPPLSKEDAWELFCKEVGDVAQQPAIEPIAKHVAEECAGIPLAIKVTGEAMAGKTDVAAWLRMLRDLMDCNPMKRTCEKLFLRLKLSCDRLESEVLKDCFSAISFYAKDHELSLHKLIEHWIMEGYIDFTEEMTLSEIFGKGGLLVRELIDAGLLDVCDDKKSVRINSMMKKLALIMKSSKFIIKNSQGLVEAPEKEAWEEAKRISLRQNRLTSLHQNPNCPKLTALDLHGNPSLSSISPEFFEQIPGLSFLDLSMTKLDSVPESVSKLVKLKSLDLGFNRRLKNVAHIGTLKQLLVLDLSGTPIEELPEEIGELTQLRQLLLFFTVRLRRIASGIISKLRYLELFHMRGSSFAWQTVSLRNEANLQELLSLTRLSDISLAVKSVSDFEFLHRNANRQAWADDLTIECHVLETSACMSFDAESNKWKSEFEVEDVAAKLLSGAAQMAGKYENFFQTI